MNEIDNFQRQWRELISRPHQRWVIPIFPTDPITAADVQFLMDISDFGWRIAVHKYWCLQVLGVPSVYWNRICSEEEKPSVQS